MLLPWPPHEEKVMATSPTWSRLPTIAVRKTLNLNFFLTLNFKYEFLIFLYQIFENKNYYEFLNFLEKKNRIVDIENRIPKFCNLNLRKQLQVVLNDST